MIVMKFPEGDFAHVCEGGPVPGETRCTVYGIRRVCDGEVCYVGQTLKTVKERLVWHLKSAKPLGTDMQAFFWALSITEMPVEAFVIDNQAIWDVTETWWISHYIENGHNLRNMKLSPDGDRMERSQDAIHEANAKNYLANKERREKHISETNTKRTAA